VKPVYLKPVYVRGIGLWTPGYPGPTAWCAQQHDPDIQTPTASLLEGPLRRRATPLTRMSVEVLEQATADAAIDPAGVTTVWATSHGEHTPAIKLLEMMQRGEGKVSPTQFHNSVHNTAGGYASIATSNTERSTTLTGGSELAASTLLEAWCLLDSSGRDVALVLADEALQPPFDSPDFATSLAIAVVLSREPKGARVALSNLRRDAVPALPSHPHFGRLHVSAALPLLESIALGRAGCCALELAEGSVVEVNVETNAEANVEAKRPTWCVDIEVIGD